jgi:DMSO reductase anchor subunit
MFTEMLAAEVNNLIILGQILLGLVGVACTVQVFVSETVPEWFHSLDLALCSGVGLYLWVGLF